MWAKIQQSFLTVILKTKKAQNWQFCTKHCDSLNNSVLPLKNLINLSLDTLQAVILIDKSIEILIVYSPKGLFYFMKSEHGKIELEKLFYVQPGNE